MHTSLVDTYASADVTIDYNVTSQVITLTCPEGEYFDTDSHNETIACGCISESVDDVITRLGSCRGKLISQGNSTLHTLYVAFMVAL